MQKRVRVQRKYSEEFKKKIVKDYESGKESAIGLSRLFDIDVTLVYSWVYKYSTYNKKNVQVVEMKESSSQKLKAMEKRLKELEAIVGQKQIKIDYLEKMIDLADQEFGIKIKKNSDTPQSIIFKNTENR